MAESRMLPVALNVAYPPSWAEDKRPLADNSVGDASAVGIPNESNGLRWGHCSLHPGISFDFHYNLIASSSTARELRL
jgi:hypothetical protein